MKKLTTLCAAILLIASVFLPQQASAQTPGMMSYQAVVRDGNDALVATKTVGMQISILQATSTGTAVYTETQTPTTNANGLVSLEIGAGTTSDDFTTINWSAGPYFIKTETDPAGGTNYSITGTSQLMSVPYALYAKTSENGITAEQTTAIETNTAKVGYTEALVSANTAVAANTAKTGITTAQAEAIAENTNKVGVKNGTTAGEMQYWDGSDWASVEVSANEGATLQLIGGVPTWTGGTAPLKVGDYRDGGVVFYVAAEPTDLNGDGILDQGLVCVVEDQNSSTGIQWHNKNSTTTGATATGIGAGSTNTTKIINNQGAGAYAATVCDDYSVTIGATTYDDWFLPSKEELNLMYQNKDAIETTAVNKGGSSFAGDFYWSSTEIDLSFAWSFSLNSGSPYKFYSKGTSILVRAIRAF